MDPSPSSCFLKRNVTCLMMTAAMWTIGRHMVRGFSSTTSLSRPMRSSAIHPWRFLSTIGDDVAEATSVATALTAPPRRVKTVHIDDSFLKSEAIKGEAEEITVKGWVRTIRKQKTLAFVQVNDGSNMKGIQCVVPFDGVDESTLEEVSRLSTGAAIEAVGVVVSGNKGGVELAVRSLVMVGECPADTYPLAKKRHSLEYLRTLAHLRPRTNTVAAVSRVRSTLAGAIHSHFQSQGFIYVQTPLITASDCEGAGDMFQVTATSEDFAEREFFGKPAYLTVSGQLNAETYACAMGDVYTFGPTFRAENSQTARHLAEFHMVEPEMAFTDLEGAMDNVEAMLKDVVSSALKDNVEDLEFFDKFYNDGALLPRLQKLVDTPFVRISYREAVELLQKEIALDPSKWQFPEVVFGTDLATEHERWLAETKFESAVFVYDYPASIKAFYMRSNDGDNGETVHAMDLLVPGVGELVGGSQREERLDVLLDKMKILDLDPEDYWWYLDLRRFGTVPHSGYGLGFERLVTYVCGIENIRDAIAFPRYPGNAEF